MRESSHTYTYKIDNQFFADIDAPQIQKGDLDVQLTVQKSIGVFVLDFHTEGVVYVPCDRCLDDVEIDIDTDNTLKVKLGEEESDDDEFITVSEMDGFINIAWYVYEFIALSLPIKHVHAPGECNEAMLGALNKYLKTDANADDMDDDDDYEAGEATDDEAAPKEIDPRWNELKKILNNN